MDTFCRIRDIYRAIIDFEAVIEHTYGLSLNEGMLLCSLSAGKTMSSSEIAEVLGLTCSNTSKIIKSVERKGLIKRTLGETDRRSMFFTITGEGMAKLEQVKSGTVEIPQILQEILF